jgi:hypothetical protein
LKVDRGVRHSGAPHNSTRLLAFLVDALQKHVVRDAGIRSACAGLQRDGVSVTIRLELVPGDRPPQVTALAAARSVPEWTEEDTEILRSLGIARDASITSDDAASEPGRQQSR